MIKKEKDLVLKEVSDFCDEVSNKEKIEIKKDKNKLILKIKADPFKGMTNEEINDYFNKKFSF